MSYYLQSLKWPQVTDYLKTKDLILFPVGSTEQHGYHLPLMTDSAWAIDVAEEVAAREKVLMSTTSVRLDPPPYGLPGNSYT